MAGQAALLILAGLWLVPHVAVAHNFEECKRWCEEKGRHDLVSSCDRCNAFSHPIYSNCNTCVIDIVRLLHGLTGPECTDTCSAPVNSMQGADEGLKSSVMQSCVTCVKNGINAPPAARAECGNCVIHSNRPVFTGGHAGVVRDKCMACTQSHWGSNPFWPCSKCLQFAMDNEHAESCYGCLGSTGADQLWVCKDCFLEAFNIASIPGDLLGTADRMRPLRDMCMACGKNNAFNHRCGASLTESHCMAYKTFIGHERYQKAIRYLTCLKTIPHPSLASNCMECAQLSEIGCNKCSSCLSKLQPLWYKFSSVCKGKGAILDNITDILKGFLG